jgi:hypothetical protein
LRDETDSENIEWDEIIERRDTTSFLTEDIKPTSQNVADKASSTSTSFPFFPKITQ